MSENCFVWKLKGVVSNDNLPKLGEMKVVFIKSSSTPADNTLIFSVSGVCTVKTDSNHLFYVNDSETGVTEYEVNSENFVAIKGQNEDYTITVTPKYTIRAFNVNYNATHNFKLDIKDLSWVYTTLNVSNNYNIDGQLHESHATAIGINYTNICIDFSNFLWETNSNWISSFACQFSQSKGRFSTNQYFINNFKKTTAPSPSIDLSDCNVTGDVIEFANALVSAGKNSGNITMRVVNNNIARPSGVNTSFKINFGSTMENPTAEDMARGYQFVNL